jgi:glucose-6-phosphate isomerase
MAGSIGAAAGLEPQAVASLEGRLADAVAWLEEQRGAGLLPFLDVAERHAALAETRRRADELRPGTDTLVVLAGGGAGRGVSALGAALAGHPRRGREGAVGLVVLDNVDPEEMLRVLGRVDLKRTVFHVVSRSGGSVESVAQFLVVREHLLQAFGAIEFSRRLLITTDPEEGILRQLVNDAGFHATDFPAAVTEGFAVLCPELLLGAELMDLPTDELLAGAASMQARCLGTSPQENPAAMLAGTFYLLDILNGGVVNILMPYSTRLRDFADWWRHLWAESLGKRVQDEGCEVALGPTPIRAMGASDHYSQLQLYLDGPADKVLTFLRVLDHQSPLAISAACGDLEEMAPLGGRTMGEVLDAEQLAAEVAFARRGRPSLRIDIPAVTPFAMGELFTLMEMAVVLLARLHGVDAFSQPAAESVERRVLALLGGAGAEAAQEELEAWRGRREGRWIL